MQGSRVWTTAAPEPFVEILVGMVGLVVIIFVHGASLRIDQPQVQRALGAGHAGTARWRVNLLLAGHDRGAVADRISPRR